MTATAATAATATTAETAAPQPLPARADVIVIGAGHNGLVAATLLARAGLDVLVLEAADVVGGATRTERPFPRVPGLRQSTGSYLLGLMPPELLRILDVDLPVLRRDPHYFLPTAGGPGSPYLLVGSDREANRRQLETFFSAADVKADDALQTEIAALREDVGPSWLHEPLSLEDTTDRYVRPELREVFVELCRGSVADYLARFDFASELLMAMYVVTDGISGLTAGPDTPGSGHNFLVHNMCRLPQGDGTWMVVRGGMGTVSGRFAEAAQRAGARIARDARVSQIQVGANKVEGVSLADGREIATNVVLGCCDPFQLENLVERLPVALQQRLDRMRRPGTTLKVNLALRSLPTFRCLPPDHQHEPFGATVHLLPDDDNGPLDALRRMWADVQAGRLPAEPTIEWYVHTTVDPSLQDEQGHHSSALFVQSVPYDLDGTTWDTALQPYVQNLLQICDRFAPETSSVVADAFPLTPPGIEAHFGITAGHIHHVDNTFAFAERMPYATGIDGLYAGSAGCHPAGSVIGAAGHNSAQRILSDLGSKAYAASR